MTLTFLLTRYSEIVCCDTHNELALYIKGFVLLIMPLACKHSSVNLPLLQLQTDYITALCGNTYASLYMCGVYNYNRAFIFLGFFMTPS